MITNIIFEVELMSNLRPPCALINQCNSAKGEDMISSISTISNNVCGLDVIILTNLLYLNHKL